MYEITCNGCGRVIEPDESVGNDSNGLPLCLYCVDAVLEDELDEIDSDIDDFIYLV